MLLKQQKSLKGAAMSDATNPQVLLETSKGNITFELFQEKAPISVRNFLSYVKDGYYDGLIFHRVIKSFMVQGGGMDENLEQKKTKFAIKNEAANKLSNKRGTVAMARTAVVDSATSQFFINVVDNPFLDNLFRWINYIYKAVVIFVFIHRFI